MDADVRKKLDDAGYDVDGALARFVNNEDLYFMFMKKFPTEENFLKIGPALAAEDYDEAYKGAHAVKGVAGNLGINPVFDISVEFLGIIKGKTKEDGIADSANECFARFEKAFNDAAELISSI